MTRVRDGWTASNQLGDTWTRTAAPSPAPAPPPPEFAPPSASPAPDPSPSPTPASYITIDGTGWDPENALPEGIVWHRGTLGGAETFANPHTTGRLIAHMSSVRLSVILGDPQKLTDRTENTNQNNHSDTDPWVGIDFDPNGNGNWLCPQGFWLQHSNSNKNKRAQTLSVEAANGADISTATWDTIALIDDSTLFPNQSFSWAQILTPGLDPLVDQYRFWRFRQTGTNSSNNLNFNIGEIEAWGHFYVA